jgi:hypothetical protein
MLKAVAANTDLSWVMLRNDQYLWMSLGEAA